MLATGMVNLKEDTEDTHLKGNASVFGLYLLVLSEE